MKPNTLFQHRPVPTCVIKWMARSRRYSDDEIVEALHRAELSLNAEAAGRELLNIACYLGQHRPSVFAEALRLSIDCMVCLGVETPNDFWRCANSWMRRSENRLFQWLKITFSDSSQAFFYRKFSSHEQLIARILGNAVEASRE